MAEQQSEQELEAILKKEFEHVKDCYYRPPVKGPKIESGIIGGTALLDWLTLTVGINPDFVSQLSAFAKGKDIADGLYAHEFGHYRFHPISLPIHMYLSFMAKKAFKDNAAAIYAFFTDFECNNLVFNNDFLKKEMQELLKATYPYTIEMAGASALSNAIFKSYNKSLALSIDDMLNDAYQSFAPEVQKKVDDCVAELENIMITSSRDYGIQSAMLIRFGKAIEPLIEVEKKDGKGKKKQGRGEDADSQADGNKDGDQNGPGQLLTPEDIANLPTEVKQKVRESLRHLAKDLPKGVYDDIKKYYFPEKQRSSQGAGIGNAVTDMTDADMERTRYYMDIARAYGIFTRVRRTASFQKVKIPFGRQAWNTGNPPIGLDLRFSGGRILPGLTMRVRYENIPYPATMDTCPDLVIYKDASGSMSDPSTTKCYGTVAGSIFIMSYHQSGADVAVAIFDSDTSELFRSRKSEELVKRLASYKGGGTSVNMKQLENDLKNRKEGMSLPHGYTEEEIRTNPLFRKYLMKNARIDLRNLKTERKTDFVIITDGGIGNIDELLKFFHEHQQYRPSIIHTGGFGLSIPGYDNEESGVYEGVTIYRAFGHEDIIKMTHESLARNLLGRE